MGVWFGWHAALLQLDETARSSCSFLNTSGRLLLTGRSEVAQMKHSDFLVTGGLSPGFFSIIKGDVRAYLFCTACLHSYMDYNSEGKKFLRRVLVMKDTRIPPSSASVGRRYPQQGESERRQSM